MRPIFAKGNKQTIKRLLVLKRRAIHDRAAKVSLRIQGIILSIEKYTTGQTAKILKVNRTTVPLWINNWNNYHEEGLLEGYRSGRKSMLSKNNLAKLYDIIESGPVAYGLNTGVWTCPIITQIIDDEFGVEYHVGHVWKILKKIGLSVQRPGIDLVNGDINKKHKWVRFTYPDIKKKPKKKTLQ